MHTMNIQKTLGQMKIDQLFMKKEKIYISNYQMKKKLAFLVMEKIISELIKN